MKKKFSKILGVGLTLALLASMLITAAPAAATHTSSATIGFAASTVAGEASILNVAVTNASTSECAINIVKIDFSDSDFAVTGAGVVPENWTGAGPVADVVTYTAAAGFEITDPTSVTFSPAVTNPQIFGPATVPAVLTTDIGAKAISAVAGVPTGWIAYEAVSVGVGGNAITVEYVNPNSENSPLSVSVTDKAITVSLKTDDGGVLISTASEVATAINGHGVAGALVDATADVGNLTYVVLPLTVSLSGGISPNVDKDCPVTPLTLKVTSVVPGSFEVVAGTNNAVTAGEAFSVKITALKADETIETKYAGAHFIDFEQIGGTPGTIPGFELISFTDGVGTSPANFILTKAGEAPTIKATDNELTPIATGTSLAITINPTAFSYFTIVGPGPAVAGKDLTGNNITVTAYNADNEIVDDYTGTVSWSSSDENAVLPPAYTFITANGGNHEFPGKDFTLNTAGKQTITVTDAVAGVSETSALILVNPAAAASMVVTASPDVIRANGADTATITATFLDKFGNVVWVTPTVDPDPFSTSLGALAAAPSATAGVATTTLTSDKVGTATIRVTSGSFDETTTLKLVPDIVDSITVTVDEAEATILNDGVDQSTITATYKKGGKTVTAADGADYTVTFTATTDPGQSGDFTVTGGTITIVPDTGDVANTGTISGQLTGATTTLLGDFTATLTLKTTFTGLPFVTNDLVVSGTITATTMTFSGTITPQNYPFDGINAETLSLTGGTITVASGDVAGSTLTGPGITSCDITGSMVVGVTLSAASVNPVAGVATVTLTTVADKATVITVTAKGIGATTGNEDITVAAGSFKIPLAKGWNLISLPLVPTDPDIDTVLAGLIEAGSVDWVDTFIYEGGQLLEKKWDPPAILQNTLMNDGQGYWVNMNAADVLVVAGSELPAPPAVPPTYTVYEGWNLIGFTSLETTLTVVKYLGPAIAGTVDAPGTLEAMYGYDADVGAYTVVLVGTKLLPGEGYWLAVNADGKIYPPGPSGG